METITITTKQFKSYIKDLLNNYDKNNLKTITLSNDNLIQDIKRYNNTCVLFDCKHTK